MGISDWSSDVCSSDLVPDRIAAGFPDGYLVFVKLRPQFRCALQAHKMNLNILPGSQVKVSRSIFIRNIGDGKHFPESQEPNGYFDPDRTSVESGKRVPVRVDLGARRILKNTTN